MADDGRSWEEVLRSLLGNEGAERAIEAMREAGLDPAALGDAAGIPSDPAQFQAMIGQLRHMLDTSGDEPVNWKIAYDVARQQVHAAGDPWPSAAQDARVQQQLQLADLWLDSVTELVGPPPRRGTLGRAQWVEEVLPTFESLVEPVAENVVRAVGDVLTSQLGALGGAGESGEGEPGAEAAFFIPGLGLAGSDARGMLQKIGGASFGMQFGQAVANLAQEAFGLSDLGVPLTESPRVALVPSNVDAFADGFDIPSDEISQFLAVREVAHARLYAASPWLRSHVLSLIQNYANEIAIDLTAMEEAFREIDPTNSEEIREAMGSGIFQPAVSDSQRHTLESLETTLAMIEGWVEFVTAEATRGMLPNSIAMTETMRRRRASGGPAEDTFKALVGLELRPRRLRDAATLWQILTKELGPSERDAYWAHPDLLPTAAELDDPQLLLAARATGTDFDDALTAFLKAAAGEPDSADEPESAASAFSPTEPEGEDQGEGLSQAGAANSEGEPEDGEPDDGEPGNPRPV